MMSADHTGAVEIPESAVEREASFLLDRLQDFCGLIDYDDLARDWDGHVQPSAERLRKLLTSRLASAPAASGGAVTDEMWQELLDKDDRTSPEEYPEMALITRDEFADFLSRAALAAAAPASPASTPSERGAVLEDDAGGAIEGLALGLESRGYKAEANLLRALAQSPQSQSERGAVLEEAARKCEWFAEQQYTPGDYSIGRRHAGTILAAHIRALAQSPQSGREQVETTLPAPPRCGRATPITKEEAEDRQARGLHVEWAEGVGLHYFPEHDPTPPADAAGTEE